MYTPQTYPVTYSLALEVEGQVADRRMGGVPLEIQHIIDAVGAYEHGNAEVTDVDPNLTLTQYAAVALDICTLILAQS